MRQTGRWPTKGCVCATGVVVSLSLLLVLGGQTTEDSLAARAAPVEPALEPAPQVATANPLRNAYFGDLHIHTSWSLDSYIMRANRDGPSVAYRYGRGDPITQRDGSVVQLRVPLDFMAVTDHDGTLGEVQLCEDRNDPAYDTATCRDIRTQQVFNSHYNQYHKRGRRPPEICGENGIGPQNRCYERSRHLWHEIQQNADEFNEPGRFTTFPGFEWTASPPGFGHLHRNVIFEGRAVPEWGGSSVEMQNRPERLWAWLQAACTGDCRVVAIPHNPNLSGGVAFAESGWAPHTPEMLRLRAWAEPLVEIHQIKGNSECYLGLGTTDEECGFENYLPVCEPGHLEGRPEHYARCAHPSDYVRNALKAGLRLDVEYGVNPFKFGLIASTDGHRSRPGGTDEADYTEQPTRGTGRRRTTRTFDDQDAARNPRNPGGLVGVWAEENTRTSIFDALRRRETFGTSGTRIRIRFFGGWQLPADLHARRSLVEEGYRRGVPMGSDLPTRPANAEEPQFVLWAAKDAVGSNLQKIQIIKGWIDGDGETHEQVYDAACGGRRLPDAGTHRCPDPGAEATVDLVTCRGAGDAGSAELSTTWADPDFNPSQRAFYYARALELPTCRWTTHRALARETPVRDSPVVKERAWSSPIWYTPNGEAAPPRTDDGPEPFRVRGPLSVPLSPLRGL